MLAYVMKLFTLYCILFVVNFIGCTHKNTDLIVMGNVNFADGIGRQSIGLVDCLQHDVSVMLLSSSKNSQRDLPKEVKIDNKARNGKFKSDVMIFEGVLPYAKSTRFTQLLPNSTIKIAYSMFESSEIPELWPRLLNTYFDAVVVPHSFLAAVYKKCKVTIPIFVLPLGCYLEDFLAMPIKKSCSEPFVFGCASGFFERKNYKLLISSFAEEFGNRSDVVLRINGRTGKNIYPKIVQQIKKLGVSNIEVSLSSYSWQDYRRFLSEMDCYVSLSKGEGFSVIPREALALGIPCIVSNNTAQKTICDSGFVLPVASTIKEPAHYAFLKKSCGYSFNCKKSDVKKAMRKMFEEYQLYLKKAHEGRNWVQQYLYKNLKAKYLNLVRPKQLRFGQKNKVEDGYLMTNSKKLYKKYKSIIKNKS